MNLRTILVLVPLILGACLTEQNQLFAEMGWNIGQTSPNFQASYLESGVEESINWYDELNSGADFYVISTCAMWCTPCQQFAADSQSIVNAMAQEGIQVEVFDWIFEDINTDDPDAIDAQLWIDNAWTADSENVWFGGDIPISASDSVIEDIFTVYGSSGAFAIPNILILDRNLVVRGQIDGYTPGLVENAVQSLASQSVPEPSTFFTWSGMVMISLSLRRRRER